MCRGISKCLVDIPSSRLLRRLQVLFVTPLIFVVKPRLPIPDKGTVRPLHLGFFRNITFWIFQVGNVLEGFGYFMPSIYLPCKLDGILDYQWLWLTLYSLCGIDWSFLLRRYDRSLNLELCLGRWNNPYRLADGPSTHNYCDPHIGLRLGFVSLPPLGLCFVKDRIVYLRPCLWDLRGRLHCDLDWLLG